MPSLNQAKTPPAGIANWIRLPMNPSPSGLPTPPLEQQTGLSSNSVGPTPMVLTTTHERIRQWVRPSVSQFRIPPIQPQAELALNSIIQSAISQIPTAAPTIVGGGSPAPPHWAVQFNDPLGTFAGSADLLFEPNLLWVGAATGGEIEIDSRVDPFHNYFLFDGEHAWEYNNGAGGHGNVGGMEFWLDDSKFPIEENPPISISSVSITNKIGTLTLPVTLFVSAGKFIYINNCIAASFLNDATYEVIDRTATTVRFFVNHANYGPTSDSGTVGEQISPGIIPLLIEPTITKPGTRGTAIGVEVDLTSKTPINQPAHSLIAFFASADFNQGANTQNQARNAYGLDVGDISGALRETAGVLIEPQSSPDEHYYGLKIESEGSVRDAAAVAAYSSGELYAYYLALKTNQTVGAATQTHGSGLWDATSGATALQSDLSAVYTIEIVANGATNDYWSWSAFGDLGVQYGSPYLYPMVAGSPTILERGVTVTWASATGHTVGDRGTITVTVNKSVVLGGSGTPEAAITALPGSIFLNGAGGAGTSFYVKESGSGNTGWVAPASTTSPTITTPKWTAYTVAGLPAGSEGQYAYASDGRKVGEGAGTGTGCPVYFSNASWRVFSTDAAVTA